MYVVSGILNWFTEPFQSEKKNLGILDRVEQDLALQKQHDEDSDTETAENVRKKFKHSPVDFLPKEYGDDIEGIVGLAVRSNQESRREERALDWKRSTLRVDGKLTSDQIEQMKFDIPTVLKEHEVARANAATANKIMRYMETIRAISCRLCVVGGGFFLAYATNSSLKRG